MKSLFIVSNRLPLNVSKINNKLKFYKSVGGLATALSSFYKKFHSKWIGWPGIGLNNINDDDEKKLILEKMTRASCIPIFIPKKDFENYYYGFSNKIIWPLFHYFPSYSTIESSYWNSYKKVNRLFADVIIKNAEEDSIIWIHDYHLMLVPQMVKKKLPNIQIGFFLHIPFPSSEVFRILPWRKEILKGLLGADLIGFHTYGYLIHFVRSARRILGCKHEGLNLKYGNKLIRVDSFPIGIDFNKFFWSSEKIKVKNWISKIKKQLGSRKVILSIDRLDYTKGIYIRLKAFDKFLKKYPEYHKKVSMIMVVVPSREGVENYINIKKKLDELVGKINGKYATLGWIPIWYFYNFQNFQKLTALYNISDVGLITPLRDGMNLIAKEFIASKKNKKGVLILSELAGAAKELGEAIIVNPTNEDEIANSIAKALSMNHNLQKAKNKKMQERIQKNNIQKWATDFIEKMKDIKELKQKYNTLDFSEKMKKDMLKRIKKLKTRLILLDYDGTLINFKDNPKNAKPTPQILNLLKQLSSDSRNDVVIISGRDKKTLEKWFGCIDIGLVAEHGAYLKEKGKKWSNPFTFSEKWKRELYPILKQYVERTPGSFIEEKQYSIAWHYRKVEPLLGKKQANELKDILLHFIENSKIGILEGNKVIELKNININKGQAAFNWICKTKYDFILFIGDDATDEDVFEILPETSYSFKVGKGLSLARYYIKSPSHVIKLLSDITKT